MKKISLYSLLLFVPSGGSINNLSLKCARGYHKRGGEFKVLYCGAGIRNVMSLAALCNIVKYFKQVVYSEGE